MGGSGGGRRRGIAIAAAIMLAVAVTAVVLLTLDGGSGPDTNDPRGVVQSYANAVLAGDDATATRLTCDEQQDAPNEIEDLVSQLDGEVSGFRTRDSFREAEDQERVYGEYHADFGDEAGTGQFEAMAVRNDDGSWSFCGFYVIGPAVIES